MGRRNLNRIVGQMRRENARGVNAVAWFAGQSFHASAADVPFERIPMKELDKAGASLLPKAEPEHPTTDAGSNDISEDYPGQRINGIDDPYAGQPAPTLDADDVAPGPDFDTRDREGFDDVEQTDVACSVDGKMHATVETEDGRRCVHCQAKVEVCDYCTTGFFVDPTDDRRPYCSGQCAANAANS